MSENIRTEVVATARSLVVKVGTNVLADSSGRLDPKAFRRLVDQLAGAVAEGRQVVLVSSGAIAAGVAELGLERRPDQLRLLQAAAAVGQPRLMRAYDAEFKRHGLHVAQVLLDRGDFDSRERYLNARNTITSILEYGGVPVINENDTTATEEITFGENDVLSALVSQLLGAGLLVILTTARGLERRGGARRETLDVVTKLTPEIVALATGERSEHGSGGMVSKLEAVSMATAAGETVVIADGREPEVLARLLSGERIGTVFAPAAKRIKGLKRWIGYAGKPRGRIAIDAGAERALVDRGKSLLASGIVGVEGSFKRGDVVAVFGPEGRELGRGLANYAADDVRAVQGLKTSKIAGVLGSKPHDEIIHRDNLVVFRE
jgi:glutamate 5-kinase